MENIKEVYFSEESQFSILSLFSENHITQFLFISHASGGFHALMFQVCQVEKLMQSGGLGILYKTLEMKNA